MARVRLSLTHPNTWQVFRFLRPGGIRDAIPALRLSVIVDMLPHIRPGKDACRAAFPDCIIDTGAHLSTIPEYIWGQFRPGVVTPLPFDPAMPQRLRVVGLGGGTWPYELGELTIRLHDSVGGVMDLTLVAQFTRDAGQLIIPMTIGLRGGVIDGRILRAEPDTAEPFGQAWVLEDP